MDSNQLTVNIDSSLPLTVNSSERNSNSSALDTSQITRVGHSALDLKPHGSDSLQKAKVKLKSGKEVPEAGYKITIMILKQFLKNAGPIAMFELVEKCKIVTTLCSVIVVSKQKNMA
ncbi:hypothetical protein ABK905_08565 [Acerihabitans sp. KWT182]|uniref:Uncharacterized protein n=1 Tax=Acerihabitans sp. KWT182 TaxID=3157919 RepID=A0AAU7QDP5_9GAMM